MLRLDWSVIRTAATAGLVILVPAAIVSELFVSSTTSSIIVYVFFAVIMFGFSSCGYAAARLNSNTPLTHGAVAAIVAYAVIQVVGIVTSLARGEDLNPIGYPLLVGIAASFGMLGALFGDWYRRKLTYRSD